MLSPEREQVLLFVAMSIVGIAPAVPCVAADWQVVSVRVNGVPLEMRIAELPVAPGRLATALTTKWRTTGDALSPVEVTRNTIGGGRIVIGRQRGRLHETVTLSEIARGRTRVLVAVNDLGARTVANLRLPAALPAGQRVLQVIEHGAGPHSTRTLILASDKLPEVALTQWRRALTSAGWSARTVPPAAGGVRGWLLAADRGRERIDAVFSVGDDGARIVLEVSGDAH